MSNQPVQLFQKQAVATGTVAEAAMTRATAEVQAAMTIAKRFPRDETAALERIKQSCQRRSLAESATYSYPRGGTHVTGPSIRLAEALAQNWGNLDFGIVELDQRNGESQVMAYAWDLETNTRQTKIFTVKHERRVGKGNDFKINQLSDPRDIYEMVANNGARRLRACILGVIPGDVVDLAVEQCEKTLEAKDGGIPVVDRLRNSLALFDKLGVTQEMIEKRLGHKMDKGTSKEYAELVKIYNSIKDGVSKIDDWFTTPASKPKFDQPSPEPTSEDDDGDLGPQKSATAAGGQSEGERQVQEQPPTTSQPAAPETEDAKGKRLVKAVKQLLGASNHSEVELMDMLHAQGLDDSIGTLAECAKVASVTLQKVHDDWGKYHKQLTELKAKK